MFSGRLRAVFRRLSFRLTLWHSLLFLGSALALVTLTYVLLRNRINAAERDVIEFRLNQYASEYVNGGLPALLRLAALRKGRAQKAFFVRLADADGRMLFLRNAEDWAEFHPEQLSVASRPNPDTRGWINLKSAAGTELLLAVELLPDGGVLHVGKSNEELQQLLDVYRTTSFFVLLVFLPASFYGGAFLASRALRPVQDLTGAAQNIVETSRFDARVPSPESGDELDALVRVFNKMLERIDVLVRSLRESIDNVAHDLRTPITRLRHKAQTALEGDAERPPSQRCEGCEDALGALAECVEEADRVSTMLNTLMEIAETEAGLVQFDARPVAVAELIQNTILSYSEFADERQVTVSADISPDLQVRGNAIALSRVFANLLDNATKYTPAGGKVSISAEKTDHSVAIRWTDTGVGISEEDLPRIWERLFRGDRSRSERGLGLGLSFVRAIIHAHGGTAQAESKPGAGTVITVTLPSA